MFNFFHDFGRCFALSREIGTDPADPSRQFNPICMDPLLNGSTPLPLLHRADDPGGAPLLGQHVRTERGSICAKKD